MHHRAADKDGALQRILRCTVERASKRRQQAVFALAKRAANVLQQEAAGAVGVLGITRLRAHLTEQRGLLVARDARNLDALKPKRRAHRAKCLTGPHHLWQHGPGYA